MKQITLLLILLVLMTGCSKSKRILADKDFNHGDWLLANTNHAEKTLKMIDNEQVLLRHANDLWIEPSGDCAATTCDGFLKLFQDGKLIAEDSYLSKATLFESPEIIAAYEHGVERAVVPNDKIDFDKKWDSLLNVKCYPTIYRVQPEDRDIILVYMNESKK